MEITPSSPQPFDLETMRSRIGELEAIQNECGRDSDVSGTVTSESDELLRDCAVELQNKVRQIVAECSDFRFLGIEDLDAYLGHLSEELSTAQAESAKISNEIEILAKTSIEDSSRLENDLEQLKASLDLISSQALAKGKEDEAIGCLSCGEEQVNLAHAFGGDEFEIFRLDDQIEKSNIILNSLQDLESMFKRLDTAEQIEDALSGLKVIEFDGTFIRLSLQTYVPKLEDSLGQQISDANEPWEVNHELLIEVISGTLDIKNVQIFPNDVYIGDVIDAAKSSRQLFSELALVETRSSLHWFVRKVQDRIIQCTLRRYIVKDANKTRHSLEYLDRDEIIVAHLVGGVDALIKFCQGWPIVSSPLKLASLKNSDHHSNEISPSFLCKVEEAANSLDVHMRQSLSSFVDAVEKIIVDQTRIEVH